MLGVSETEVRVIADQRLERSVIFQKVAIDFWPRNIPNKINLLLVLWIVGISPLQMRQTQDTTKKWPCG